MIGVYPTLRLDGTFVYKWVRDRSSPDGEPKDVPSQRIRDMTMDVILEKSCPLVQIPYAVSQPPLLSFASGKPELMNVSPGLAALT